MSENTPEQPYCFAHLTDPHLTSLNGVRWQQLMSKRLLGYLSWSRKRRDEHRPEVLQALASNLKQQRLQHIVVTGDLTHISLPDEFLQARRWLDSLGTPGDVSIVPGNHDALVTVLPEEGLSRWAPYMDSDAGLPPDLLGSGFPSLRLRQNVAFIGLSSALPTAPLSAMGCLGKTQLDRFARVLEWTGQRAMCRVVFIHHPPVPGLEKWRKRLTDAEAVSQVINEQGAELVLHGHSHRPRQSWLNYADKSQIPVVGLPSASSIHHDPERTARYNLYQLEATAATWKIHIQTQRYSHASASFEPYESRLIEVPRSDKQGKS